MTYFLSKTTVHLQKTIFFCLGLHLFADCIARGLYDYQMCAAEVSHSSTCEVYSSAKEGNDKSCLF